ncbi:MAG TPA: hypothetical protein VJX67_11870 [Blastocatellia bacterium]|nr:hypothetical protein [Blastocatellia bacterium]
MNDMTMVKDPFEDFKTREDHGKWEPYIKQCGSISGMSPEHASRARLAIEQLRDALGDDKWLAEALRTGHPLLRYYLLNATAWTRSVLIRIAEAIEALRDKVGFARLMEGLRDPAKFPERQSVLDAGYRFHRAGFDVVFDPKVRIPRKVSGELEKEPDIKLIDPDSGEELFVEVSAQHLAAEHDAISRFSGQLNDHLRCLMRQRSVLIQARFHEEMTKLSDSSVQDILIRIDNCAREVQATGTFETLAEQGVIEVGIAPLHLSKALEYWAAAMEIEKSQVVSGPSIALKDLKRLVLDKFGKEVRQLPMDRPGILIVTATDSLLFAAHHPEEVGARIAHFVQRWPQLICAAVTYCHGEERRIGNKTACEYWISENLIFHPLWETHVGAFNPSCRLPVHPTTRQRIRQAFRQ